MSALVSRLVAQAEASLGEMSQRAVERAMAPVRAKSQEVIDEVVGTAGAAARTIAIKVALAAVGGLMLLVAVILGLVALYAQLKLMLGAVAALAILAGGFLLVAIVAFVVMIAWPSAASQTAAVRQAKRAASDAKKAVASTARAAAAKMPDVADGPDLSARPAPLQGGDAAAVAAADQSAAFGLGIDDLASALGEAGFRREAAGVKAGLAIARQLRPMQLVSLALVGGVVLGLRLQRK